LFFVVAFGRGPRTQNTVASIVPRHHRPDQPPTPPIGLKVLFFTIGL
jgi:hypothetical protein